MLLTDTLNVINARQIQKPLIRTIPEKAYQFICGQQPHLSRAGFLFFMSAQPEREASCLVCGPELGNEDRYILILALAAGISITIELYLPASRQASHSSGRGILLGFDQPRRTLSVSKGRKDGSAVLCASLCSLRCLKKP